jgi:hypothetical protein
MVDPGECLLDACSKIETAPAPISVVSYHSACPSLLQRFSANAKMFPSGSSMNATRRFRFTGSPLCTRPTDSRTGAGHQQPEFSFMTVVRIAVPDLAVGKKFYKARLGFEVETVKSGLRMHLSSESHPWIEIDRAKANHQLASLRLGGWLYVRVTASCYPRLSG